MALIKKNTKIDIDDDYIIYFRYGNRELYYKIEATLPKNEYKIITNHHESFSYYCFTKKFFIEYIDVLWHKLPYDVQSEVHVFICDVSKLRELRIFFEDQNFRIYDRDESIKIVKKKFDLEYYVKIN